MVTRSEFTTLSVQEEENDTIVHQLSTSGGVKKSLLSLIRKLKKSLKSLPTRGIRKAAINIKHYKTTADSISECLTLYEDDVGPNAEKRT